MSDKNDRLKNLVSKMVKEQLVKAVPVLKETIMKSLEKEIKYQISEAVNEKLMKLLVEGGSPSVALKQKTQRSVSSLVEDTSDRDQPSKKELEAARMKIKAKVLAEQNPMLQGVFEDILTEQSYGQSAKYAPGQIPPDPILSEGGVIDDDSEGVNLDSFPEFTRRLR